jgi:hypothetical protein
MASVPIVEAVQNGAASVPIVEAVQNGALHFNETALWIAFHGFTSLISARRQSRFFSSEFFR